MATVDPVSAAGSMGYGSALSSSQQSQGLTSQDFLELMVAQLSNQDFMDPVDDTQFLAQMAQFTTMQQTQEMANLFKQSYVLSLVGQNITAAKFTASGEVQTATGPVSRVSLVDNEFLLYIGDEPFSLDQIMTLNAPDQEEGLQEQEAWGQYAQGGFLLSLMGSRVTVCPQEGETLSGEVARVALEGMQFEVDGQWYSLGQLVSVDGRTQEDAGQQPDSQDGQEGEEPDEPDVL